MLEQPVKFFYPPLRLCQLPLFRCLFFFCYGFLFYTHSFSELFFMVRTTGNRQFHVREYALYQDNGADKMCCADLFPSQP